MTKAIAIHALLGLLCAVSLAGCDSSSAQGGETLSLLVRADFNATGASVGSRLINVDGTAFFLASDAATGQEPWISDETPEGTGLLKDIMPGPGDSNALADVGDYFVKFNGLVYFAANDGMSGLELWRTDGTEAGTQLVADLKPGPEGYANMNLRASANRLYISAFDGITLSEVWVLEVTP